MAELPKFARERLAQSGTPEPHPDANLISAFVENSLTSRERAQVLDHLSRCAPCRAVAGMALPEPAAKPVPIRTTEDRMWARWTVMRWATLAVSAVVIAAAVLVLRPHEKRREVVPDFPMNTAISASPAKPAESAPEAKAPAEEKHQAERWDRSRRAAARPPATAIRNEAPVQPQLAARARQQVVPNAQPGNTFIANAQQQRPGGPYVLQNQAQAAVQQNQNVAVAPSPPPPARADLDKAAAAKAPGVATETVEVTAGAAPVESTANKQNLPKTAMVPGAAGGGLLRARPVEGVAMKDSAARWTISAGGKINRSFDAGQTWAEVPVGQGVAFRAVSANGADIWAGGSGGALFHSSDGGEHWTRVRPSASGSDLSADITRIEFTDAQHGTVLTATGERWTTADAGRTWTVTR